MNYMTVTVVQGLITVVTIWLAITVMRLTRGG